MQYTDQNKMDFEKQGFKIITNNIVILMLQITGTVFIMVLAMKEQQSPFLS